MPSSSAASPARGGRLLLGGSETARTFGGYMDGALERAEELASHLGEAERETGT